jgi:ATP-dependent helicase/nuclease subunit B
LAGAGITGARWFGPLEDALLERLRRTAQRDAARVWVLVPTNLLGLHLRRLGGRRLGGMWGVSFLTLKDAAARLAARALADGGYRPVPPGGECLVVRRLLAALPAGSALSAFASFANAPSAVLRAFRVLENALWTPAALERAAAEAPFGDRSAPDRLADLAALWRGLRQWKEEHHLFTPEDLIALGAPGDARGVEYPDVLLLYGFYDLTAAQRALVGRLIEVSSAWEAYLLWEERDGRPEPGFEYAEPLVDWLNARLPSGAGVRQAGQPAQEGADLSLLTETLFHDRPYADEESVRSRLRQAVADGSVRVLNCPGEGAEAAEVVREMLRAAAQEPIPRGTAVVTRAADGAVALLDGAFARAGVSISAGEGLPLAQTPSGRAALALLEAAAGAGRRAEIIAFCSLAEIVWPEGLSAVVLDRLSREAGVVSGAGQWTRLLRARGRALSRAAQDSADEAESRRLTEEGQLCEAAGDFVETLFERLDLSGERTWRVFAAKLHLLVAEHVCGDEAHREAVLDCVARLADLDATGVAASTGDALWVLGSELCSQSRQTERFQHTGVTVASLMASRGVTFDVVVVPQMVERRFPGRIPEEPLLSEPDRESLNAVAAGLGRPELPLRRARTAEERYLLRVAVGAARCGLVLTYSRLEEDTGRVLLPSRFLGDVCSALAGVRVSPSLLGEDGVVPWLRRTLLDSGHWDEGDLALALDAREYDAAVSRGAGAAGDCSAASRQRYLESVSEWFSRAVLMEGGRWRTAALGPYDGAIRAEDLAGRLQAEHAQFAAAVSPTRLETYAACPFRYFLRYMLGLVEIEEPEESVALAPDERGLLVHALLGDLFGSELTGRVLGSLDAPAVDRLVGRAQEMLGALGRAHAVSRPAVWRVEQEAIKDEVRSLLEHECDEHPAAAPELCEYEFEVAVSVLGPGAVFRGRIDRVDRLPDGGIRVVDYKTGRSSGYPVDRFAGGTQLQLPIYLLAAAELLNAASGEGLYFFLRETREVRQFTLAALHDRLEDLREVIELIREGIASGDFFPLPSGQCPAYCPYVEVCGSAREQLAEMKRSGPGTERLTRLREIR